MFDVEDFYTESALEAPLSSASWATFRASAPASIPATPPAFSLASLGHAGDEAILGVLDSSCAAAADRVCKPGIAQCGEVTTSTIGERAVFAPIARALERDVVGVATERQCDAKLLAFIFAQWASCTAPHRQSVCGKEVTLPPPPPKLGPRLPPAQDSDARNSCATVPEASRLHIGMVHQADARQSAVQANMRRPPMSLPTRPPVGCCQAVRVGRRRVAVRRVSRQLVGGLVNGGLGGLDDSLDSTLGAALGTDLRGLGGGRRPAGLARLSGGLGALGGRCIGDEWGFMLRRSTRSRAKPPSVAPLSPHVERATSPS